MWKLLQVLGFASAALGLRDITPPAADGSTYSNIDEVQTYHMNLTMTVDFNTSTFSGNVLHKIRCVSTTDIAVFDIIGIDVSRVELKLPEDRDF